MGFSFGRKTGGGTVGLQLDSAYLAAVGLAGRRIVRASSQDLEPGLITDGEVADPARLGKALRDFAGRNGLPRRVRLGVANRQIVVRSLELPRIEDEGQRSMAVRYQAADAIAMPLDEVVFDYQVVGEATGPEGPAQMRVVVVAARESMIASLLDAVQAAGLKPESIDLDAFALVRTLAPPSTSDGEAHVYCHLGGVTNLAVAVGSTCLFTRPLSIDRDDEGRPVAASLADEVRLSLDYYMAQPDARSVGAVALSGPGSSHEGLADELSGLVDLPVSVPEPLGALEADEVLDRVDAHRYTVAAGLALGAAA